MNAFYWLLIASFVAPAHAQDKGLPPLPDMQEVRSLLPKTIEVPLKEDWDDAVSWDESVSSQPAYPNPSSHPWAELLIGDSRTYYKMANIRTYFRFMLDLPEGADILSAKILLRCSAGGQTKPKLDIRYVDAVDFSFRKEPWKLPLSRASVPWEDEEHGWNWITHEHYQTPELKALLQDWLRQYKGRGYFGIAILNRDGNRDNFKGISSFDDEKERSARLLISYR